MGVRIDIKGNRFSGCHGVPSKASPYINEAPWHPESQFLDFYLWTFFLQIIDKKIHSDHSYRKSLMTDDDSKFSKHNFF